ncbi:protein of unknown function [Xenorhabdus nematophila AN6/1]|nr:hypothetical protein XNA1_1590021 [Xenorhabdus nematophila str. Anatoliense]CEE91332.1 hypothetical protein XNA1_2040021 [Xenorhabdus nematophila str. Anatoliense]CEK24623.1 protein of unknown function [Xenorhabdus nematophila AN6/1]
MGRPRGREGFSAILAPYYNLLIFVPHWRDSIKKQNLLT